MRPPPDDPPDVQSAAAATAKGKAREHNPSPAPQTPGDHDPDDDDPTAPKGEKKKNKNSYKHLIKGIPGLSDLCPWSPGAHLGDREALDEKG